MLANGIWQSFERRTTITKWDLFWDCETVSPLENMLIKFILLRDEN